MKVLITTIFDYPHEGGLSTHVTTLKKGLETSGHTVDVLSISNISTWKKKLLAQGPGFLMNKLKKGKGQLTNDKQRMKLLAELIKDHEHHYDIINSQDIFATLASLETNLPVVATIHGYYAYEAISRGAIETDSSEAKEIKDLERKAYTKAVANITVDQRIKDYVYETAQAEATVVRNFIDPEPFLKPGKEIRSKFGFPENAPMLFVPRRLTEKNGVIYPLIALKQIAEKHPDVILVYAGTGEQLPAIKKKTSEFNLEDHVYMLGSVAHSEMVELYKTSQIALIPSVHSHGVEEATSISALEAMGSGTPVIAGAVGGLKELIDHRTNGLLFADRDEKELTHHILYLLDNPLQAQDMANKAQQKIQQIHSHSAASEKFLDIYAKAIQKESTPSF
ncbi:glycosyltransferase family 4 protein [Halobacillus sp. Marseille-Q1614]|uniref:glycosyltransferase family 4 protein n=1 Tax=Halobacillus sp. Marseille-Q1614 TaxID=2709134 RepID=UPI00156F446C|nr:glycosyltransferase family 4 protein [Halobacillus sp. Marseille-Q1614]